MNYLTKLKSMVVLILFATVIPFHASFAQEMISDDKITTAIETEMWLDEAINANNIDIKTNNGVVTFTGTVENILAEERAVKIAESVKGVIAIVNRIDVKPVPLISDSEIKKNIQKALLYDPATELFDVSVDVSNGVATLTGNVQSAMERKLCSDIAKSVKGVSAINNDIEVTYNITRSDTEILEDVQARLENDVQVDDLLITVTVQKGNVNLSGTVGSLREKNRAHADAWVAGVNSVNTDDLKIEWWARDEMRRKDFITRTDEEIETAVNKALLIDPRVFSFDVDVTVNDGTAILNGVVDNLLARVSAEQDARNTTGVWRVQNHIKVRPVLIPSNEVLEKNVSDALINNQYVDRFSIAVDAMDGVVYLSGKVNTSFEKFQAEKAAQAVKGVTYVYNNIAYDFKWTWQPDWEIEQNIVDQLTWNVFVDEDLIIVEVDDGIAKLTGQVYSWSEYQTAERNAYEGGAKDVDNQLVVSHQIYGPYNPINNFWWGSLLY